MRLKRRAILGSLLGIGLAILMTKAGEAWEPLAPREPVAMETCFSPREKCERLLIGFLDSAKVSVDVAIYSFTHKVISDAIVEASKRGVRVRVLVDRDQAKSKHSLVGELIRQGIEVKYGDVKGIMHHKFTVVDGRMVQTGSFNYTWSAATRSAENQIYIADAFVVSRFMNEFEQLFAGATPMERSSLTGAEADDLGFKQAF